MLRFSIALLAATAMTACSGGGSSSSSSGSTTSGTTNSAPTVTAGANQSVADGTTVSLSASAADSDGDAVTLTWSQTSGTPVTLSSTSDSTINFIAPTGVSETLVFQVSASDGTASVSDSVSVVVSDGTLPAIAASFDAASLAKPVELVSCTVGGSATTCMEVELLSAPQSYTVGPWCPRTTSDDASTGGIWLENGIANDVDGTFITNLSVLYNDSNWKLYNDDGTVNYTETQAECAAAARPDVAPEYQNHCVECQVSFIDDGLTTTYLIPVSPVAATGTTDVRGGVGIAFSGAKFDGAAPVDAILAAYTIAPFDDCGGHVNLNVGYHIHAVTEADNCLAELASGNLHAPQIGLALDGYPIHQRANGDGIVPSDLDTCGGHDTDTAYGVTGYHYHVGTAGSNEILACLSGELAR